MSGRQATGAEPESLETPLHSNENRTPVSDGHHRHSRLAGLGYVAAVIDRFSRVIVGQTTAPTPSPVDAERHADGIRRRRPRAPSFTSITAPSSTVVHGDASADRLVRISAES